MEAITTVAEGDGVAGEVQNNFHQICLKLNNFLEFLPLCDPQISGHRPLKVERLLSLVPEPLSSDLEETFPVSYQESLNTVLQVK